jgi:hypothetical protein
MHINVQTYCTTVRVLGTNASNVSSQIESFATKMSGRHVEVQLRTLSRERRVKVL